MKLIIPSAKLVVRAESLIAEIQKDRAKECLEAAESQLRMKMFRWWRFWLRRTQLAPTPEQIEAAARGVESYLYEAQFRKLKAFVNAMSATDEQSVTLKSEEFSMFGF